MDPILSPDLAAEPDGFMVVVEPGDRIHFLDWGVEPDVAPDIAPPSRRGVLLIHGLSSTAWVWTAVARRLRGARHVVAMDLRGHGLSDAPTDGYDPSTLASDVVAVAEGSGLLRDEGDGLVIAGHGFGAILAAWAAAELGERCSGVVLVDGGWESIEATSGLDVDDFLRGVDEPPEVMRSMSAFLADRQGYDPVSWDPDQERAARATVVETRAGKVVPATRPHALEASVRAMFGYEPALVLSRVSAPISVLSAADDERGLRSAALSDLAADRARVGLDPIAVRRFPHDGHNLMRYRPDAVSGAIMAMDGSIAYRRG